MKSVEESLQQLANVMFEFCQKTRRQRINQRNRTERLSEILDWARLGNEYVKARFLAIKRKFNINLGDDSDSELEDEEHIKIQRPLSLPDSPRFQALLGHDEDIEPYKMDGRYPLSEDEHVQTDLTKAQHLIHELHVSLKEKKH
jgi:glycogen(starch) synthase